MTAIFELLFKYQPLLYQRGTIAFHPFWPFYITLLLAAAAVAGSYLLYRRTAVVMPPIWRYGLSGLRAAAFIILLFLFLRPVLRLHSVIPQKNFVAIAYDMSKSMEIRDGAQKRSRLEVERQLLRPDNNPVLQALAQKFKIRFFSFSRSAERVPGFRDAPRHGNSTDLERTLNTIAGELAAVPVAGIVLFTDGADNHSSDLTATAGQLHARNLPVYTVGIGSPDISRDTEVVRVTVPRKVLKDTLVEADVAVRSAGYSGQRARLLVLDRQRQLQGQEITLGRDGEVKTYKVHFSSQSAGPGVFRFRVEPFPEEIVPENNDQTAVVRIEDEKPQILYVEGEPRWEYSFVRRAILADKNLHLITLLRQADGKFLRQGVESASTLDKGFPNDKAELFQYKAILMGSMEASFFTFDQLRIIADFVSRRGGGLLMLGGKHSFGQGGYIHTPLEDVLPLDLGPDAAGVPAFQDLEFQARLTPYGFQHPITRLSLSEDQNRKRWESAPALVGFNPTANLKPGATSLLQGSVPDTRGQSPVILAFQRFGRGKSVALTTASSWRWRMGQEHTSNFHELFWKQMLRWLVSDVPDPLNVTTEKQSYPPDDVAIIRAEANDASFMPLNDARVLSQVRTPSGKTVPVQLAWDIEKDGGYSAAFKPEEEGIYEISSEAFHGDKSLGTAKASFQVADSTEEFHNASMNSDLLKRLSSATGGRHYSAEDLRTLPEDISYIDKGASRIEEKDLWDMPFLFLLLAGVMCTEWILRKRKGLA
jgi:uncharacterized membrane protein